MKDFCLLFLSFAVLYDLAFYMDSNHLSEYYQVLSEK